MRRQRQADFLFARARIWCNPNSRFEKDLLLCEAVYAGQGLILPLEKLMHFFLGPWLLVCQFIDISNQMEPTGEVANI